MESISKTPCSSLSELKSDIEAVARRVQCDRFQATANRPVRATASAWRAAGSVGKRPLAANSLSSGDHYFGLNLYGKIERQSYHAHGRARMATDIQPEDLMNDIGKAIHD